jgi:hypothetical protein
LLIIELYVFISVIIYIGVYKELRFSIYWNIDFTGLLHPIINYIVTGLKLGDKGVVR